jgi:type IV pilus assembly protein PilM
MAASNVCWGVEIGSGAVKAVKLESDGDSVRVLEFGVLNHPKVLSTPELDTADAVRIALGALSNQFDLSGASLAVSVPGHQSFARFAKLPPVEPKKVPDIVKFEAVQQIPFPLEEVEWDYQTFVSPDSPDVEVGIFAVTRPRIMELLTQLGDVGLTPDIATLSPVAAYNALAYDLQFTEQTPGTIILDVGTVATDLIIAEAGRVWVRTFPLGGHQFTDALVTAFKLTYSKAERLKREAEQTKHARHVFQAMRPVFTDLVQEVQRSIGYYQSVHAGADLKRLIGVGSTFRLPGLRKYLKQQLHLDIYRIEEFKRLKAPEGRDAEFNEASLNLATAYGLALQGLGFATLQANVMPVKVVRDAMWRRKRVWFGAAAGMAAAATAAFFVRPLIDTTAVDAATEPSEIQRVVNEGKKLKADAEAAGVLGNAEGDTTASSLIGLLADRGVYASLLNDMGLLLEDVRGSELFGARPEGLRIASLETNYEAPKGSSKDDDSGGRSRARSSSDEEESTGMSSLMIVTPTFVPGVPAPRRGASAADFPKKMMWNGEEIDLETRRRVNVSIDVATEHEDPEEVAIAVVQWLREHAARADAPYVVALKSVDTEVYTETTVPPPVPSSDTSGGSSRGGMRTPRGYPAGGGGGLLVIGGPTGQAAPQAAGLDPRSDDPQALIAEMEKIAAIKPPASVAPAPVVRGQASDEGGEKAYRVVFTLVLDKPSAVGGEGGDS